MALAETAQNDPLLNLRFAITSNSKSVLTSSSDPPTPEDSTGISKASYIHFSTPQGYRSFSLDTSTRFTALDQAIDLRSIYFAWLNKDVSVQDYLAAITSLNEELSKPDGAGGSVLNLPFGERFELLQWLQGEQEDSDYIQPLEEKAAAAQATGATDIASGVTGSIDVVMAEAKGLSGVDARLVEIYKGERGIGDRNSVLRGGKPTDFTTIRKQAELFIGRKRPQPGGAHPTAPPPSTTTNPALVSVRGGKPASTGGRRLEPIVLLSPSASSLLRMSNIKQFLEGGIYVPPDSTGIGTNILHTQRPMRTVDPQRPLRFILVDTPDQFKPDYWQRVVAVFTTGQTWQFKSYKWTNATELFSHALGIYVGWAGEQVPDTVKGWGRMVKCVQIEKWNAGQGEKGRWRDREVVESIWTAIEESMRARGWAQGVPSR